jgi:hypothetical protein
VRYYSITFNDMHGWIMYYGAEPLFRWLTAYLDQRVPGLSERTLREERDAVWLYLPDLPRDARLRALRILAEEAPAAAADFLADKSRETRATIAPEHDRTTWALGDVKTLALIARNLLAREQGPGPLPDSLD